MDAIKLIEPAVAWQEGRWLDRVEQSASFLFMHGYITQSQRQKVSQKLERQLSEALTAGVIVSTPTERPNHDAD